MKNVKFTWLVECELDLDFDLASATRVIIPDSQRQLNVLLLLSASFSISLFANLATWTKDVNKGFVAQIRPR